MVYVEAKAFDLTVDEWGSFLRFVEKRRGLARVVLLGKGSVAWLKNMVESLVGKLDVSEFINSCREGDKAFIIQRGANRSSRFLE